MIKGDVIAIHTKHLDPASELFVLECQKQPAKIASRSGTNIQDTQRRFSVGNIRKQIIMYESGKKSPWIRQKIWGNMFRHIFDYGPDLPRDCISLQQALDCTRHGLDRFGKK
ncbi:hypothetical protein ACTVJH_10770 [Desulfoplanes sp. PS50]|jgi:hypothetical protein